MKSASELYFCKLRISAGKGVNGKLKVKLTDDELYGLMAYLQPPSEIIEENSSVDRSPK